MSKDRIAHGYVFYGPEDVGKRTIALDFAQALLCEKKPRAMERACGQCDSCVRCERRNHPAVIFLDPEHHQDFASQDKNAITIDDIREIRRLFSYAAGNAPWRVLIMDQAEKMTRDALGAFLKLFEEPGERALMILVTSAPDLLPGTILSRAQTIGFSLVPENLLTMLHGQKGTKAETRLAALAKGRPGRLVRLRQDPAFQKDQEELFASIERVAEQGKKSEAFALSERVASDPRLRVQCIESLVSFLRERLLVQPEAPAGPAIAQRLHACDRIATILETTNVSPRMAMDALLLAAAETGNA